MLSSASIVTPPARLRAPTQPTGKQHRSSTAASLSQPALYDSAPPPYWIREQYCHSILCGEGDVQSVKGDRVAVPCCSGRRRQAYYYTPRRLAPSLKATAGFSDKSGSPAAPAIIFGHPRPAPPPLSALRSAWSAGCNYKCGATLGDFLGAACLSTTSADATDITGSPQDDDGSGDNQDDGGGALSRLPLGKLSENQRCAPLSRYVTSAVVGP